MVKIKITGDHPSYWYAGLIGKELFVTSITTEGDALLSGEELKESFKLKGFEQFQRSGFGRAIDKQHFELVDHVTTRIRLFDTIFNNSYKDLAGMEFDIVGTIKHSDDSVMMIHPVTKKQVEIHSSDFMEVNRKTEKAKAPAVGTVVGGRFDGKTYHSDGTLSDEPIDLKNNRSFEDFPKKMLHHRIGFEDLSKIDQKDLIDRNVAEANEFLKVKREKQNTENKKVDDFRKWQDSLIEKTKKEIEAIEKYALNFAENNPLIIRYVKHAKQDIISRSLDLFYKEFDKAFAEDKEPEKSKSEKSFEALQAVANDFEKWDFEIRNDCKTIVLKEFEKAVKKAEENIHLGIDLGWGQDETFLATLEPHKNGYICTDFSVVRKHSEINHKMGPRFNSQTGHPLKYVYRGGHRFNETYRLNDVIQFKGKYFIAQQDNFSGAPTTYDTFWHQLPEDFKPERDKTVIIDIIKQDNFIVSCLNKRKKSICRAISRRDKAGISIPKEWHEELREISEELKEYKDAK